MSSFASFRGILFTLILALALPLSAQAEQPVVLAEAGQARLAIVIGPSAAPAVKDQAASLADYLQKISGAKFAVQVGDGSSGLALGVPGDFPALATAGLELTRLQGDDLAVGQSYLLRSHQRGLWLIGASDLAVRFAAWDLLYRLGYRQFFPGANWEIVPSAPTLAIALDRWEKPDYFDRRIWYGFGGARDPKERWDMRNRLNIHDWRYPDSTRFVIQNAHSYGAIITRNKAELDAHPEYYALIEGKRGGPLCLSQPRVQEMIREYALDFFKLHPDWLSISMEPSDGGRWCECENCVAMGSESTRVIRMANLAAEVVTKNYGRKFVGVLAYHDHALPPAVDLHPNVVVCLATALSRNIAVPQNLDDWRPRGGTLGIYDYWGVFQWHLALPAKSRGADLAYMGSALADFHQRGARVFVAESGENWGACGLGYYVASRVLWDLDEGQRIAELVDDFLQRCFGPAQEPMRRFYQVIDARQAKPGNAAFFHGRAALMYAALAEARKIAADPGQRARIDELVLYTRYVELTADRMAGHADSLVRLALLKALVQHSYRIRHSGLAHWAGMLNVTAGVRAFLPEAAGKSDDDLLGDEPDKDGPYPESEIAQMLAAGVQRYAQGVAASPSHAQPVGPSLEDSESLEP